MSESPWSPQAVLHQVQDEIRATSALATGGVLILDESPDEKAGVVRQTHSDGKAGSSENEVGEIG